MHSSSKYPTILQAMDVTKLPVGVALGHSALSATLVCEEFSVPRAHLSLQNTYSLFDIYRQSIMFYRHCSSSWIWAFKHSIRHLRVHFTTNNVMSIYTPPLTNYSRPDSTHCRYVGATESRWWCEVITWWDYFQIKIPWNVSQHSRSH